MSISLKSIFRAFVILLGLSCFVVMARADGNTPTMNAHVLLGTSTVSNSGGTNFSYGLGGTYNFMPPWSAGLDITNNSYTVPSPLTASMLLILAHFKYNFNNPVGLAAGLKVGSASLSVSGGGASLSSTNVAWGPTVSYDYSVATQWTVGAEANMLWITALNPSVSIFQLLANAKYWF